MKYAKIVVGLPVDGPFDYSIPKEDETKIKEGARVRISFGPKKMIGYVVALSGKTAIKAVKPIREALDDNPVLDTAMLELTKQISDYYCCSWGEAIEAALPPEMRRGKKITNSAYSGERVNISSGTSAVLVHGRADAERWTVYTREIKQALISQKSVIVIFPDVKKVIAARECLAAALGNDIACGMLYRGQTNETQEWLKVKNGEYQIVLGTRSSIFAPLAHPGLIIIDDEQSSVYKQEQTPHYHVREVASMRARIQGARLVLGSRCPTLESYFLAKKSKLRPLKKSLRTWTLNAVKGKVEAISPSEIASSPSCAGAPRNDIKGLFNNLELEYLLLPETGERAEIKIVMPSRKRTRARGKNTFISDYITDAIIACLNAQGKALIYLNRTGYANVVSCPGCHTTFKCPRCSINLVYHFKKNQLSCHYCNFTMTPPQLCPVCRTSYITFAGTGIEKIENEVTRLIPTARIRQIESDITAVPSDADICIAHMPLENSSVQFDMVCVLGIDTMLNRVDFRSGEKTLDVLTRLVPLTRKKMFIQSAMSFHHCFQSLITPTPALFYDEELRQRKQLNFPPYTHLGIIKMRGKSEEKVHAACVDFAEVLKTRNNKKITLLSVTPSQISKLRGNYYWQILMRAASVAHLSTFIKSNVKAWRRSGIIVTVDVDPL